MSIQILYKGFNRPISSQEAITLLTQLLKGDRAKAEDAFMAGTYLLKSVESESELQLLLPRY